MTANTLLKLGIHKYVRYIINKTICQECNMKPVAATSLLKY